MSNYIGDKLEDFEKRSWAIKVYTAERWGNTIPCPLRLVVNTYHSCQHKCGYCYVWSLKESITPRSGFRKALFHDIERGKQYGISSFTVEMSASTDPLQPIEKDFGESLFAIKELLGNGFKVLIVTKNPALLLNDAYRWLLKEPSLSMDVTITSLREGSSKGSILNNNGPSAADKVKTIKTIIDQGKLVRVRIDPVVPHVKNFRGQSEEDLKELVGELAKAGVKLIISKTMRLCRGMPKPVVEAYYDYYKSKGKLLGSNYILATDIRRKMLSPIYEACRQKNISFCPCCDVDVFAEDNIATCSVEGETALLNRDIML
ncbi:MAG: radical SAM protein [bacterium]|nr:radical SAM protein [bacterium]